MAGLTNEQRQAASEAARQGDVEKLAAILQQGGDSQDAAAEARAAIAHAHYFDSWGDYDQFKSDLLTNTRPQQFEQAADAIAAGDVTELKKLLAQNPGLVTMRSPRNHHSTLLNYVGANGFEHWRQKTPKNAVEVATILLDAGAEVDAWGDMYRGTSTLGLVATSVHPVITGVQEELMDFFIKHGADPNHAVAPDYTEGLLILACLHNGRYEPVKYLAGKGAVVDLEGAGGVGDLEKVKSYFDAGGRLQDQDLEVKRDACMIWACVTGHIEIVSFLLGTGVNVNTGWDGHTPLHSAAFGGQIAIVRLLLQKGAAPEALNSYGGTVLGATLWAMYNDPKPAHLEIMETLIAAGAEIKDDWQQYVDEQRQRNKQ